MGKIFKFKFLHIDKIHSGWSFGFAITRDSILNEFYLYINLFKWSVSIGKLSNPNYDEIENHCYDCDDA